MKTRTVRPTEDMRPITRAEYLELMSKSTPWGELQNGFLVRKTAPQGRHGRAIRGLLAALWPRVRTRYNMDLYEHVLVDFDDFIFVPDLVFVRQEHSDRYSAETGRIHGPPDLVVEIVSHDSGSRDRVVKFNQYFRLGVPFYWIVDPFEFTLEEWHAIEPGYVRTAAAACGHMFRPKAFPGFALDSNDVLISEE